MVTTSVLNKAESPSSVKAAAESASTAKTSIDPPVCSTEDPLNAGKPNDLANTHSHSDSNDDNNITNINTANTLNGNATEGEEQDGDGDGAGECVVGDVGGKSREILEQNVKLLPKASPPPQIIVIPASASSTAAASSAAKKIRRAFSMPRNPFRWSHKLKTSGTLDSGGGVGGGGGGVLSLGKSYTLSSCVGGNRERSGSFVSINSNEGGCEAVTTTSVIVTTSQDSKVQTKSNEKQHADGANAVRKLKAKSNTLNGDVTNVQHTMDSAPSCNSTTNGANRLFRRSSFRKFLNRITQHVTNTSNKLPHSNATNGGHIISSNADRVPPIGGYQWPTDQTPGVMGLKNHGNTCFMNAVLQCLSHTDILAEYFVLDQYKADLKRRNKINSRKFGTKGELTEQLANVLKALWTCKNESDHSTSFKAVVDRYGSQFRSSTQHDAQEFLFWLLDKVHEDLNTATKRRYKSVKNNYGRPDEIIAAETLANHIRCNNSFVQAVFQAQFRSSLTCPRCKKQSNTFDPFHCISVQLPQLTQQTIFVTVVYLQKQPRQMRMGLTVTAGSPIVALREQLHKDTGIRTDQMVLVDLQREGFSRVFYDSQPVNTLQGIETIYCVEVPMEKSTTVAAAKTTAATSTSTSATTTATETATSTATPSTKATIGESTTSTSATTTANNPQSSDLLVLIANVKKTITKPENADKEVVSLERFGSPFCLRIPRDCSYAELQKKLLKEMSSVLKPEVFSYSTPLKEMFQIRLQDPSADPDTFVEQVEHPLLTEMIDLALSVLSSEAGPAHIKLLLEWPSPETHFTDLSDQVVEHESVPLLMANKTNDTATLTLEQCLEHYTKAETLSAEDAWRCPHCQEYLPVVKTLGLWSLPDILVVHFKRFRQHQGKETNAAKLTTMVKFPLHSFDMSPHLAKDSNGATASALLSDSHLTSSTATSNTTRPSPWRKSKPGDSRSSTLSSRENRETRYDLYAVCYHQGDTLETGHYTAACKNPYDRAWYKFDDQRVTKVASDAIPDEIVNNEAYMLFYQRRSSENVECSGSSSNSSDHWISRIAPPPATSNSASCAVLKNSTEKLLNEAIPERLTYAQEESEHAAEKSLSQEVEHNKPEKVDVNAINENGICETDNSVSPLKLKQNESNANSLDALEKILDYADAEEITDETEDIEVSSAPNVSVELSKVSKPQDEIVEIFAMDEDCTLEDDDKTKSTSLAAETPSTNAIINPSPQCNGLSKEMPTNSPLIINECNGTTKKPTAMSSANASSSSSSSLESQSTPSPSATLVVAKEGANSLETKFNGFSPQSTMAVANEKEHTLSTSLKSNSSSIISSALAGHFQSYRQPWHGSRSSVSAVENATHPSSSSTATVTSHPSLHLRHSFSTASNYRLRECTDTLSSVLRNSVNTCSKDTLIFLDQQQHHHHHHHHNHHHHRNHHSLMEDDDDSYIGSRSLWISPVTPHKLITVSPKN